MLFDELKKKLEANGFAVSVFAGGDVGGQEVDLGLCGQLLGLSGLTAGKPVAEGHSTDLGRTDLASGAKQNQTMRNPKPPVLATFWLLFVCTKSNRGTSPLDQNPVGFLIHVAPNPPKIPPNPPQIPRRGGAPKGRPREGGLEPPCAFKRSQIAAIKAAVTAIDRNAFIIVCEAHDGIDGAIDQRVHGQAGDVHGHNAVEGVIEVAEGQISPCSIWGCAGRGCGCWSRPCTP